jgi:hypothetical protein
MKRWISSAIAVGITGLILAPAIAPVQAEAPSEADRVNLSSGDRSSNAQVSEAQVSEAQVSEVQPSEPHLSNDPLTRSNDVNEIVQPSPNLPLRTRSGDWATGYIHSSSGNLPTPHWLIVHATPLNCREQPNGRIRANIEPGAIVTAVYPSGTSEQELLGSPNVDAIVQANGSTWLRVTGTTPGITPLNDHYGNQLTELGVCYVRANARYVAPINPAAMQRVSAEVNSQALK